MEMTDLVPVVPRLLPARTRSGTRPRPDLVRLFDLRRGEEIKIESLQMRVDLRDLGKRDLVPVVPPRPDLVPDEVTTSSRRPRPVPPSLTGGDEVGGREKVPGEDQLSFKIRDEVGR